MFDVRQRMGEIGEQFVHEHHGEASVRSEDWYDRRKDSTISGLTSEIKTMTMIQKGEEYWLELNQFDKVTNVDLLFIVDIPLHENEGCAIYLVPNNKNLSVDRRYREGKVENFIIIKRASMYKLTNIQNDDRVTELVKHADSLSSFRRKLKNG